jgi:hypothetical protein
MANSLHMRGGCEQGPVVECSYDYSTSTPRYKYVIRRATSASYVVNNGSPIAIALEANAAVGYLAWNSSSTITITAKGCGCDATCVIPPCCAGKDYLRLSFSGFRDLSFHYERTFPPPDFGERNIFGSWDTSITGLDALNGTWLLPIEGNCLGPPLDTGIDITWTCRWFSYGARYTSTRVLTGETWNQDLVGTAGFRLWLQYGNVYITNYPGTMVGSASKTAGLGAGYNYTFNSVWWPKITAGTFQVYDPIISTGRGIVESFSASNATFIGVGVTSLMSARDAFGCGRRVSTDMLLTQYVNGSHWVLGEGAQPAYGHSNTGPTSYSGPFVAGQVTGQYISVP